MMISHHNWFVSTIRKHIHPNKALSGRGQAVGVDEAVGYGVIISALEIIEAGFGVVVVAPVAEGIDLCHGAGGVGELTPGVVGVAGNQGSAFVEQTKNVTL